MNKEIAMKQKVLGMLQDFLMGSEGSKFKPKEIEVEMVGKPTEDTLEDDMDDSVGMRKTGMSKDKWESSPEDEEMDEQANKKGKMSLKEFLASKA